MEILQIEMFISTLCFSACERWLENTRTPLTLSFQEQLPIYITVKHLISAVSNFRDSVKMAKLRILIFAIMIYHCSGE